MSIALRDATAADLPAIDAIYDHYVRASTCTFQLETDPAIDRRQWLDEHAGKHPAIVACDEHGAVIGYGSLSPFRPRGGYRFTIENSVYVRHDAHRRGIGRALLDELIARGRGHGHRSIIATISTEQTGSLALHQRCGFIEVGRLREVGFKHEGWLDVAYLQLLL